MGGFQIQCLPLLAATQNGLPGRYVD